jgi:hypothetical protein
MGERPQGQRVVDRRGRATGVLLPIKAYERLLEDLHDLAVVAERREEKPISLDELKRRFARHGASREIRR